MSRVSRNGRDVELLMVTLAILIARPESRHMQWSEFADDDGVEIVTS